MAHHTSLCVHLSNKKKKSYKLIPHTYQTSWRAARSAAEHTYARCRLFVNNENSISILPSAWRYDGSVCSPVNSLPARSTLGKNPRLWVVSRYKLSPRPQRGPPQRGPTNKYTHWCTASSRCIAIKYHLKSAQHTHHYSWTNSSTRRARSNSKILERMKHTFNLHFNALSGSFSYFICLGHGIKCSYKPWAAW